MGYLGGGLRPAVDCNRLMMIGYMEEWPEKIDNTYFEIVQSKDVRFLTHINCFDSCQLCPSLSYKKRQK